ncbi:MAG: S49 family peptidase [Burkholderiaceae bacterium]
MDTNTSGGDGRWERETLEKLVFQTLKEQRSRRRWTLLLRLLWLAFLAAVAWMIYQSSEIGPAPSSPHTAVIEISGEIAANSEASADQVNGALRAALEDSGSKGVVLLINSPGGSPVQAGIINDEIHRLRELHGKPIYAVVGDTCASAAYYIASAADAIYVDKASIVGSIGVLMDGFGFTGLMEKVGVERRLMTAGANKAFLDPFSPQDAEQRAYIQGMLDEIHRQFIEVVRKGRGDRLKADDDTFSGLIWNGQQAIAIGLADGLGTLDSVAREQIQAEEIIDYTQRENFGLKLARRFGASIGEGIFHAATAAGLQLR